MRAPLAIAVAQPRCRAYDVAANAVAHASAIRSSGARVVVFPELSLTGYELDAPAIGTEDTRLQPIVEACAAANSVAFAGAPVGGEAGLRHIGVLAIDGAGVSVAYRKMHLGGGEPQHFSPGSAPAAIDVDGWRLGLAVCKDTGIPQHAAATAALGIDAYLAGVLESAEDVEVPARRARRVANDHHVWVAMASFAGSTGGGYSEAAGCSGIWGADGVLVVRAGPEAGAVVGATIGAIAARRETDRETDPAGSPV